MQGHEDHALAIQLRLLEVFQALDVSQARQALARPPPAHGHFKERDAGGSKVFLEQLFALRGGFFREAQLQVARGDAATLAGHAVHARTQQATNGQQRAIRQLSDQPQQAESQP